MAKRLKAGEGPLTRNGLHLTIVIYWHPRGRPDALANGHAALIIDGEEWLTAPKPEGETGLMPAYLYNREWYVSWLGGKVDWHPPKGSKKGGNKGIASHMCEDMCTWGGEAVSDTPPFADLNYPIRWVAIQGLQTQAMHDAWDAARNKVGAHWRLFDKNCATMVHTILKAGGGDQLATGHKKQLVWWPSDLIRYARSMTGHVHSSSSTPDAPFQ